MIDAVFVHSGEAMVKVGEEEIATLAKERLARNDIKMGAHDLRHDETCQVGGQVGKGGGEAYGRRDETLSVQITITTRCR